MTPTLLALLAAAFLQVPQDPPGVWDRNTLLGDFGGVRAPLADRGVTLTLAFTGEVISCIAGGLKHETGADLLMDAVIDADLAKALGWTGGSARVNPMWLAGDGISGDVGDLSFASNITGRGGVRLFEAWLQQAFAGDAFSLRAGILAADQEFAISTPGLLFSNSVFGGPVFLTPNLSWPIYPVGALGARVKAVVAEGVHVQAAVYDGDPGTEDFNRSGVRIRLEDRDGVFAIAEAGWTYGTTMPGALKAGLFHHSGEFTEFSSGTARRGLTGGYIVSELKTSDALSTFLRFGFAREDRAFVSFGLDAGILITGLLPDRPKDVLGLGVIYGRISRDFARSQPDAPLWGHETVLEATYKIILTPWCSLQPDLQYIVHPGGSTSISNATIVGLRIDVLF